MTTVLGANGAGKSSLASAIAGVVKPSAGRIEFEGEDITGWTAHRICKLGLSFVPESRNIFPHLSVRDNLWAQIRFTVDGSARRAALDRAFEMFPILGERRRQQAGTLSGGEQQMLTLARVLAAPPKLLIADEMSLGLAPLLVDLVFESLERARNEGVTVLLIEQFVERALGFADEAVILRHGLVGWRGQCERSRQRAPRRVPRGRNRLDAVGQIRLRSQGCANICSCPIGWSARQRSCTRISTPSMRRSSNATTLGCAAAP